MHCLNGCRKLLPLGLLLAGGVVAAQGLPHVDSDQDGVSDDIDAAPCDPQVSARVFVPADRVYGMMMFEDSWPDRGDFDFNDAVVAYNQVLRYDSSGRLTGLRMELGVLAVGAGNRNGLALRLPGVPRANVTHLTWSVSGSEQTGAAIALDEDAAEATLILAEDLHALFGQGLSGAWLNTDRQQPHRPFAELTVDVGLAPGAQLSAAAAPFDLFLFDRARGTEVHRPRYGATPAMNANLFGTGDDGSTPGRRFVTTEGIPFALELPELTNWPTERTSIDQVYPQIVAFGLSAGAQAQDFYRHLVPGLAYGLTPPRSLAAQTAPDTGCFAPEPGACGAAAGNGSVDAPVANLCSFGTPSAVTSMGGLWRWTCAGNYAAPTACTTADWVCAPNLAGACAIEGGSGTRFCNGSGSGFGTCTVTSCNAGHYQSGNACLPQACAPGAVRSCAIANGTGVQTCDNLGSGYGGCVLQGCNAGYVPQGNGCLAQSTNTLVPGNTTLVVSRGNVQATCQEWNGSLCTRPKLRPVSLSCSSYSYRNAWHSIHFDGNFFCFYATGNRNVVSTGASTDPGAPTVHGHWSTNTCASTAATLPHGYGSGALSQGSSLAWDYARGAIGSVAVRCVW